LERRDDQKKFWTWLAVSASAFGVLLALGFTAYCARQIGRNSRQPILPLTRSHAGAVTTPPA